MSMQKLHRSWQDRQSPAAAYAFRRVARLPFYVIGSRSRQSLIRNHSMSSPTSQTLRSRTTSLAVVVSAAAAAAISPSLGLPVVELYPLLAVALLASAATTIALQVILPLFQGSKQPPAADCSYPSTSGLATLIKGRRSIFPKDFSGEPVERDAIEQMLASAIWAPSHKLTEPWHFVVLAGESKQQFIALTRRLCQKNAPAEKVDALMAKLDRKASSDWKKVDCFIAICLKRHANAIDEWEEVAALSCAVQNMWLTATSLGVAGYWSSWQGVAREDPEMLEFLGMSPAAGDRCLGVFVTGKPSQDWKQRPGSRKPWQDKVDWRQ